jgi:ComF family protein
VGKTEAVRLALDALVGVTLAPACAGCSRVLDSPLAGPVCAACWDDVARGHGHYDGALRNIIQAFKYEGRRSLGPRLGEAMREAGANVVHGAGCVVPVPLHPWRRFVRGFNQAADLAAHLQRPVVHALWRTRATAAQAGLTASQRRRNVRGAFRLSPLLSRQARETCIDGRIVVVIDDVTTTGATLTACAEVLQLAGAAEVRTLTLARAVLKDGR